MLKILLVDDEALIIQGLITVLDWSSFDGELIGTASSGEEALNLIENLRPDIVISDIKMGGMNGIELAQKISQRDDNIQVILLTAYGEFEYAQKALKYGVIDYIVKPITREKIQQLERILYQKNEQFILRKHSYLVSQDISLKTRILNALKENDRLALDEFFRSSQFKKLMCSNNCDLIGVALIGYLYTYLENMNLEPKAVEYSRNKTLENFLTLSGWHEKMDFVITKYYDLITSINHQKHSYSDTIAMYAISYTEEHYTEPDFNLSKLSDIMHISLSHLSTVFKQSTGNNLSTYVTELRLNKAKSMLSHMQYSITDVSELVGYSDAKYFAKLFKKHVGKTPTEYRNLIIQGGNSNGN